MKRTYCLYRVSTKGQVDHDDIPMQRQECRAFAERMGWTIYKEFYEKGVSGFKVSAQNRDAIQDLKLAAEKKEFDILLVFMFDRLGRIPNETPFVLEWFVHSGIEVWSAKEGQQTFENDTDYLMNYIRFWQAGGESRKTSMRVKTRLGQLVEAGKYTGGCCPFGYRFIKSGEVNKKGKELVTLDIHPEEAAVVQFIFRKTVAEGYGTWRLCNLINAQGYKTHNGAKFQANTINRILRNRTYTGYFVKGNLFCAHCGRRMHAVTYSDPVTLADGTKKTYKKIVYLCPWRARNRGGCKGQSQYVANKIDEVVLDTVHTVLDKISVSERDAALQRRYEDVVKQKKAYYAELQKAYQKEQKKMEKLVEEVGKALIGESDFSVEVLNESMRLSKAALAEYERKIPEALKELNNQHETLKNLDRYYDEFRGWAETFDVATHEEKKMILCRLIQRINIGRNYDVEIVLNADYGRYIGQ